MQLRWDDQLVLLDPLALEIRALAPLLESDALCIMHAGMQDLEILQLVCETVPTTYLDTQIAAGFLGVTTGSLASLLDKFLQISLPKTNRLTDWLQRPLTEKQLAYAAGDVAHLFELVEVMHERLEKNGRWKWALDESELIRSKPHVARSPESAITRIREARSLKGKSKVVAAAIAAWRERRASRLNCPVRQVLPDLGVVTIAQRSPKTVAGLQGLRGVEKRHLRGDAAEELIQEIKTAAEKKTIPKPVVKAPELQRHLRPVVTLATSWIAQLAREQNLDPALVATRSDVEAFLRGDSSSRLTRGWRSELAGIPLSTLVQGESALAFEEGTGLVLEKRSRQKL